MDLKLFHLNLVVSVLLVGITLLAGCRAQCPFGHDHDLHDNDNEFYRDFHEHDDPHPHEHNHHHHHEHDHEHDHEQPRVNMYSAAANFGDLVDKFTAAKALYEDGERLWNASGDTSSCAVFKPQIHEDLRLWTSRNAVDADSGWISKANIEEALNRKMGTLYQIIGGKIYRSVECSFPGRCDGIEHFLKRLLAAAAAADGTSSIPNLEFVINLRDYPQVFTQSEDVASPLLPVFSFSKEAGGKFSDILFPAWSFWSGGPATSEYPTGIGRWDLARELIRKKSPSWMSKEELAFFRGSRTSSDRDPLIGISKTHPRLVDAKYTKNQAWRSNADTLGDEPAATVPLEEACRYKYLFNARGVAASFRLRHLFLCTSTVLHVASDWIEYFYPALVPWYHFVPVAADYSDALRLLSFLQHRDDVAEEIARNGFRFIYRHLTSDSVECYWRELLREYAQLLDYSPDRREDVISI